MGYIKTYKNGDRAGTFSQINFDNGEKIFISIAQNGVKISKIGFFSFPSKTIWQTNNLDEAFQIFMNGNYTNPLELLDSIINKLIECNSTEEVKTILNKN